MISLADPRVVVLIACAILSLSSFVVYGVDKSAARNGSRRVPEPALHALALAGGWPGALAGQVVFRHKTRKQPFRSLFWLTVVLNTLGVAWLLTRQ